MNNFFKMFWAALLAFVVANIVLGLLSFLFFVGMIASLGSLGSTHKAVVTSGSVLEITLEGAITDAPPATPFEYFDFANMRNKGSNTILQVISAIENATVDNRIEGIYLAPTAGNINSANLEELREALVQFKDSGKFIVSYADSYSQGQYYLCSVADSVYLNPEGLIDWRGMSASVMFYKGLLDKLGIEPAVIRHGSFKAAVEPLINEKMSPENRLQMQTLADSFWGVVLGDVAASRGIDSLRLNATASSLDAFLSEKALAAGLVTGLVYEDQVKGILNELMDNDPDEDINKISLADYISANTAIGGSYSKNKVKVIYADGEIVDGKSSKGSVGGATVAEKLADARGDDNVKAVVLRVNSPGGSALASEVMWREMEMLRKEKPLVVSMGGMAASGGYYISCPADVVLADRLTLTGSIGVFGLMMNLEKGLKDKLGITVDGVKTNPSADLMSPFRKMTDPERATIQSHVEKVYATFVNHVAAGRNMTFEQVDAIGQGRVWSGVDARRIGLIDDFGGLRQAIELAADRAGVASDFSVSESVETDDPFTIIMNALSEARVLKMRNELGDAFIHYNHLQGILKQQGVQARMPYIVEFE